MKLRKAYARYLPREDRPWTRPGSDAPASRSLTSWRNDWLMTPKLDIRLSRSRCARPGEVVRVWRRGGAIPHGQRPARWWPREPSRAARWPRGCAQVRHRPKGVAGSPRLSSSPPTAASARTVTATLATHGLTCCRPRCCGRRRGERASDSNGVIHQSSYDVGVLPLSVLRREDRIHRRSVRSPPSWGPDTRLSTYKPRSSRGPVSACWSTGGSEPSCTLYRTVGTIGLARRQQSATAFEFQAYPAGTSSTGHATSTLRGRALACSHRVS